MTLQLLFKIFYSDVFILVAEKEENADNSLQKEI